MLGNKIRKSKVGKKSCEHSGAAAMIHRFRLDGYPPALEIRVEYKRAELQGRASWGEMLLPHRLFWGGIHYEFLGMVVRDSTKGVEHVSTVLKVGGKLYKHTGFDDGLMRPIETVGNTSDDVRISTLLSEESNEFPIRFYYVRNGKDGRNDGPGDWINVRPDLLIPRTSMNEPPIEVREQEPMDVEHHDGKPIHMLVPANIL